MNFRKFNVYNGGVKLFFGTETMNNVKSYLSSHKRLLVVTGKRSAKLSGALDDFERIADEIGLEYTIYSGVEPNPTTGNVNGIIKAYKEFGADGFVAIGGGSVIDAAKAARAVISGGVDIVDYLRGKARPPEQQPFLLVVNLTHGTGTEIDRYAVVTIPETKEKIGFGAGYPTVSVDDPRYTTSLPRNQTIYTSLDAFAHAVESATSTLSSPYTWLLAKEAIRYIVKYLPIAVNEPSNLEARYWLLYASMIAGISIDHGVTHLGHGLEHVLSGHNPKLPHGAGLAILYKVLIKYFYSLNPEVMAEILKPLNPSLQPTLEDAEKTLKSYNEFLETIGFREKLSDYGFGEDDIREMVEYFYNNERMKRYHNLSPLLPGKDELIEWLKMLI